MNTDEKNNHQKIREKDIVFLAYSNSTTEQLNFLEAECKETEQIIESVPTSDALQVDSRFGVTREYIVDYLITYRERIIVFQFSGHADQDTLLFEDDATSPRGIVKLLAQCPKLKLVILNGCSTRQQVELIFREIKNAPVVISTSSAVEDKKAYQYALGFWKAFYTKDESIDQAHQSGLGMALSIKDGETIQATREIALNGVEKTEVDDPIWDISSIDDIDLEWALPKKLPHEEGEPNAILRERLFESFCLYKQEIAEEIDGETSIEVKETAILEALPLSISDQVRKLFARRSNRDVEEGHVFYNSYDHHRLRQLVKAYHTLIETITFIYLAQLWDVHPKAKLGKEEILQELRTFFQLKKDEKKKYALVDLCYRIEAFFSENEIPSFLAEWRAASPTLADDQFFNESIHFMQEVARDLDTYDAVKVVRSCFRGERYLANIFSKLAFIINYRMISIQGIDLKKYRHLPEVAYFHNVIKLVARFRTMNEELKSELEHTEDPKFNDSVFIERISDGRFLNLTPFIIDQNSFNRNAPLAKICHFALFDEKRKDHPSYVFNNIYATKKNDFLKLDEDAYAVVKEQLNLFKTSLLKLT